MFFYLVIHVLALRASLKSFRFSGKALELGLLQVLPPTLLAAITVVRLVSLESSWEWPQIKRVFIYLTN